MRLGVSVPNRHQRPEVVVPYALALARVAAAAGADMLMVGDKHGASAPLAQGPPLLGRLIGEATGVRSFGALFLAPLWSRLHLAETVGTLAGVAAASDAALVPILALGRRDGSASAMDRPTTGRVVLLEAAVEAVRRLPTPSDLDGVDHVWLAADGPPGIHRAARLADGWLANSHHAPGTLDAQARSLVVPSAPPPSFVRAVRRDVVCLADPDAARAEGKALMAAGYRGLAPGALIAGDPAGCAGEVRRLTCLGFDTVVVRPASPDPAAGVASVARFLSEVPSFLEEP